MIDIFDTMTSPVWWFTVVLTSFAVNIIAAYTKPFLDNFLSSISDRYKAWSTDRKKRIGKVSYYLLEHPQEASDLRGQVVHLTLKIILVIAIGLFSIQVVDFMDETTGAGLRTYIWLKIVIYFCATSTTMALFKKYILLSSILKDYDKSVYSASDRYRLKKYE